MLRHNYREEAIQIINEIPQTKMKEVVKELKKYKKEKTAKDKIKEEHHKTIKEFQAIFKNAGSSSYEFMKRKKVEKKLDL